MFCDQPAPEPCLGEIHTAASCDGVGEFIIHCLLPRGMADRSAALKELQRLGAIESGDTWVERREGAGHEDRKLYLKAWVEDWPLRQVSAFMPRLIRRCADVEECCVVT
jgi:hypothetical protein